eukprot:3176677-Pleurochrysis_carterae.AAC.1
MIGTRLRNPSPWVAPANLLGGRDFVYVVMEVCYDRNASAKPFTLGSTGQPAWWQRLCVCVPRSVL